MRSLRGRIYAAAKRQTMSHLKKRLPLYDIRDSNRIHGIQLHRLNSIWQDAWSCVPYYRKMKAELGLPPVFQSLEEFSYSVPVLSKSDIQSNEELFRREGGRPPDAYVKTGGSTGEPLALPVWKNENLLPGANYIIGRAWYNVKPGDRLFMVWGHSHMLGTGWRRIAATFKRNLKDRVLNYYRANAYHLDDASLDRLADAYRRCRPDYVVGYAGALALLSRHMKESNVTPKVVIACAETLSEEDMLQISNTFGCEVAMEYGSVECGLIAHTYSEQNYKVFWDTHLVEAAYSSEESPLLITKLHPSYVPLLRYQINDAARLPDANEGPLTEFGRVIGRFNNVIRCSDGKIIHSELIAHVFREIDAVRQYQLIRRDNIPVRMLLRVERRLTEDEEMKMRMSLGIVSPELSRLPYEYVDDIVKAPAGKARWYIDE